LAFHHYFGAVAKTPNDLGFAVSYGPQLIQLPAAWDKTVGNTNIGIAVIDSVYDNDSEDLRDNITQRAINSTAVTISHGTQVAGIIGARGNNTIGIAGAMWNTSLYLYSTSLPQNPFNTDVILTIRSIGDAVRKGIRILNRSAGVFCKQIICTGDEQAMLQEEDALFFNLIESARQKQKDILWVFSAGNGAGNQGPGVTVHRSSPARLSAFLPNVISVSAVDNHKQLASFSNFGADVTVAAPGVNILSLTPGNGLTEDSGTSFAAPYVSGVAGLMLSVNNKLTAAQIKTLIQNTSDPTGSFDPEGNVVRIIDAFEAVRKAEPQPLQLLSFVEGDPHTTGDGIIVNALGGTFNDDFDLLTAYSLAGTVDGLTISIYPATPIAFNYGPAVIVSNLKSGPCEATLSAGGPFALLNISSNGVNGRAAFLSQDLLQTWVNILNQGHPGCNIVVDDLFIERIAFNSNVLGQSVTAVDAVAIGKGPGNVLGIANP
jgi:subtilisin family serine protease